MHSDYRKDGKTGPLGLSQSKARNLATGIGQSADAAMYTGQSRSHRVVSAMPAKQKAALCSMSGYPEQPEAMLTYDSPAKVTAKQTRVDGKVP